MAIRGDRKNLSDRESSKRILSGSGISWGLVGILQRHERGVFAVSGNELPVQKSGTTAK
jgi:hypothetical protein